MGKTREEIKNMKKGTDRAPTAGTQRTRYTVCSMGNRRVRSR